MSDSDSAPPQHVDHFSGEMQCAAADIIAASQAGEVECAHYLIGALVGMTEANVHGIEVWWDNYRGCDAELEARR